MAPLSIRPCTIDDIVLAQNFAALCAEYTAESAIAELGGGAVDVAMYHGMEAAGFLRAVAVLRGTTLAGFALVIVSNLPHFSRRVASLESFFVASAERAGGAGNALRKVCEDLARECGAEGLMISAPVGGRLDTILPRSGYRRTNHVYFRSLA